MSSRLGQDALHGECGPSILDQPEVESIDINGQGGHICKPVTPHCQGLQCKQGREGASSDDQAYGKLKQLLTYNWEETCSLHGYIRVQAKTHLGRPLLASTGDANVLPHFRSAFTHKATSLVFFIRLAGKKEVAQGHSPALSNLAQTAHRPLNPHST